MEGIRNPWAKNYDSISCEMNAIQNNCSTLIAYVVYVVHKLLYIRAFVSKTILSKR